MLTSEGLREARVTVSTGAEYAEAIKSDRSRNRGDVEFAAQHDIVLSGLCMHGKFSFPYPGYYGTTGQTVLLRRDQAAHAVVGILRKLHPAGELPNDSAELLDFLSEVIREGSQG